MPSSKARESFWPHIWVAPGARQCSLQPQTLWQRLQELLGAPVPLAADCVGDVVAKQALDLAPGEVLLLENLRFHAAEEANEATFAQALARLGEVYVNDAFGAAHRAHASTAGIATYLQPAWPGSSWSRKSPTSAR